MKWEIWFSESEWSACMFATGYRHQAGTIEADAKCVATFEAETDEEAKKYYYEFLHGPNGFFEQQNNRLKKSEK